jgi:hypothetical protein
MRNIHRRRHRQAFRRGKTAGGEGQADQPGERVHPAYGNVILPVMPGNQRGGKSIEIHVSTRHVSMPS